MKTKRESEIERRNERMERVGCPLFSSRVSNTREEIDVLYNGHGQGGMWDLGPDLLRGDRRQS